MNELNRRNFLLRGAAGLKRRVGYGALACTALGRNAMRITPRKRRRPPNLNSLRRKRPWRSSPSRHESFPRTALPEHEKPASCISSIAGWRRLAWTTRRHTGRASPELQARVSELFAGAAKFSALTTEQQDEVFAFLRRNYRYDSAAIPGASGGTEFF